MDEVLTKQRDRLLLEFYRIESTVAKLQDNLAHCHRSKSYRR